MSIPIDIAVVDAVHPRVGVWIEMDAPPNSLICTSVHPRVGVWIEIRLSHG